MVHSCAGDFWTGAHGCNSLPPRWLLFLLLQTLRLLWSEGSSVPQEAPDSSLLKQHCDPPSLQCHDSVSYCNFGFIVNLISLLVTIDLFLVEQHWGHVRVPRQHYTLSKYQECWQYYCSSIGHCDNLLQSHHQCKDQILCGVIRYHMHLSADVFTATAIPG